MAHIRYVPDDEIPESERALDSDHILRIHGVHPEVMRAHFELYMQLMHRKGPLTRRQREMIAVTVSGLNECHY
jgi:alkylhydroperoxidase family enzyme